MTARWRFPRLVAHRGGGALAPENTLAGIREAARRGYRAVEFDVMLSADGAPVLIHDETLGRTTSGRGKVAETPLARLRELDAGVWFDAAFAGEPIPTFDEAARLCIELGLAANVEIKPAQGHESETGRVVGAHAARLWQGQSVPPLLSSFSLTALGEAQKAAPDLPRGVLFGAPRADWLGIVRRAAALSMHCEWSKLRPQTLAAATAAEVPVLVYTCNEPQQAARLLAAGVACVVTDRLDLVTPSAMGDSSQPPDL